MVFHSFLVIIPIVWVNKRRLSANSSSLFRTSQMQLVCATNYHSSWAIQEILMELSFRTNPILPISFGKYFEYIQNQSGTISYLIITMDHIDQLVKTIPLSTTPCFCNRMGPLNRALHFGRKLWVAENHLILWNAVRWLAIFMGSLV